MKTVEETIAFIEKAHEGQTDKGGKPYHLHPIAVMWRLPDGSSLETKLAALLHDVIEDTDWTAERLLAEGFPKDAVEAVQLVSRDRSDGLSYLEWVQTIADSGNIMAMQVKLADNEHNSDPKRIKQLPKEMRGIVKRYQKSKKILKEALYK
jgi:(p)ppGpp synthase/HD superfamily hydrolase